MNFERTKRLEGMLFQLGTTKKAEKRIMVKYYIKPNKVYKEITLQYMGMIKECHSKES